MSASAPISQPPIVGSTTVQFIPSRYEAVVSTTVEAVITAVEELQQKLEEVYEAKGELGDGSSIERVDVELASNDELAEILEELEALILAMMEALAKVKAQ